MIIPTENLTLEHIPAPDAAGRDFIVFAQTLNGYEEVGGDVGEFGKFVAALEDRPIEELSLTELRILLFALQRAHYFSGGGWPGEEDSIMNEVRQLTEAIRGQMPPSV